MQIILCYVTVNKQTHASGVNFEGGEEQKFIKQDHAMKLKSVNGQQIHNFSKETVKFWCPRTRSNLEMVLLSS